MLMWTARDINFEKSGTQYDELTDKEKSMIDKIVSFFLIGDGEIIENITKNFINSPRSNWEAQFYHVQSAIEAVHADVYQKFAQKFKGTYEYEKMIDDLKHNEIVLKKFEFMEKYLNDDVEDYKRHAAYACAEGIFFCTLFVVIFWFKSRNKLESFIAANERIMKDELIHFEYQANRWKLCYDESKDKERVVKDTLEIIDEAVAVEDFFIDKMLPEPILELNTRRIKSHVRVYANHLIKMMGLTDRKTYPTENLYEYMKNFSLEVMTNFFEQTTSQYDKGPGVSDDIDPYEEF